MADPSPKSSGLMTALEFCSVSSTRTGLAKDSTTVGFANSSLLDVAASDQMISSLQEEDQEEGCGQIPTDSLVSQEHQNPFIMPPDNEIFLLRDKERQRKRQERIRQRNLHVHEKTTFCSRVHCRTAAMIHPTKSDVDLRKADKAAAVADDTQFTLAITRDRHVDKESLAEYIAKKREMFLVQYSLGVKRDEMRKLEEIAQAEERKLELAEQFLEEDASLFDDFLKENDKNSVEAIKVAEAEAKSNMDKQMEIRKLQVAIMAIKSEISKFEETLKEYKTYKSFLDSITPPDLLPADKKREILKEAAEEEERRAQSMAANDSSLMFLIDQGKRALDKKKAEVPSTPSTPPSRQKKRSKSTVMPKRKMTLSTRGTKTGAAKSKKEQLLSQDTITDDSDSDEELELYFTDPQQVLDIYAGLEEQNLSLIQNSQETEETLEEIKQAMKATRRKMTTETKALNDEIEKLNSAISREKQKARVFQQKAKLFRQTEVVDGTLDRPPVTMDDIVEGVFKNCIGENDASMSTIQMLTALENRLEEMFDFIATIPAEKVEAAEKMKEKERRMKMREEKMEEQRLYYEERVRRALERAKAEPKRMTGRKLVYRSEPPKVKKFKDDSAERARKREEEEFNYYFEW